MDQKGTFDHDLNKRIVPTMEMALKKKFPYLRQFIYCDWRMKILKAVQANRTHKRKVTGNKA